MYLLVVYIAITLCLLLFWVGYMQIIQREMIEGAVDTSIVA